MKLFFAMLVTAAFSFSSFAACNREVQFAGTVRNLQVKSTSFSFQLKLGSWFQPSFVCPMDEEEFVEAVIELAGKPAIAEGDQISGVLVFDQSTQSYRIE